jgi:periplasmic divalent cation tolerance protein
MMNDLLQVYTTLPSQEQANDLARRLVDARHAACVQVLGPVQSTYRWEGQVEQAHEWLLAAKTTAAAYAALEQAIREAHPYQVPEILAVPVAAGNAAYLDWVKSSQLAPRDDGSSAEPSSTH